MGTVRLRIEELNTEEHANKSNTTKSQGREQSSGCPHAPQTPHSLRGLFSAQQVGRFASTMGVVGMFQD